MGQLTVFNFTTLNGFFKGPDEDISWHQHGGEESQFASESMKSGNTLLFGRVTYEMMARVWPSPEAIKNMPEVAAGMNSADKIVFSRTLKNAGWNNTRLVKGDLAEEIKKLKKIPGKDMTILGSGSLVTQLAELGLIDGYLLMVDPIALGEGTPIFKGISHPLKLKLISTKTFGSGVVLLSYEPA